jgi:hypothetical protein
MYASFLSTPEVLSRRSTGGMTLLARHARAFQAAAPFYDATGPVVGAHHSNSRSNIWRVING